MYYLVFFIVIPLLLTVIFVLSTLFPSVSTKLGGTANIVSFMTSLLTYIYVVLTGLMVHQMKKSSEEESRPFIVVDVEFKKQMLYFVLKNIGKLPAKELCVRINPELKGINHKSLNDTIFSKPISLVPPGKEISTLIGVSHEVLTDGNDQVFDVELCYKWLNKQSIKENYTIDISFYKNISYMVEKGPHEIAKTLEKIENNFSRIVKWDGIYVKTYQDILREEEERKAFFEKSKIEKEDI